MALLRVTHGVTDRGTRRTTPEKTLREKTLREKTLRQALLVATAWGLLVGGPVACRPPATGPATDPAGTTVAVGNSEAATGGQAEADRILQQMIEAYAAARSYSDRGIIRLNYRQQGELHLDEAPLAVQWKSPNQLHLAAYQLELASNGQQLGARIKDEGSNDLDQQMVVRKAPSELTLADLYSDPVIHDVLRSGLGRYPIQLELLLSEKPLEAFLGEQVQRSLLEDQPIDQRECRRVRVETEEGQFTLWVDKESFELLRLEYPASLIQQMVPPDDSVDQVRLVAELRDAKLGSVPDAETFALEVPAEARQVRSFVLPPEPLPTDLYGRRPDAFFFTDLEGGRRSQQDLQGKIAALAWFTNHPACRPALEVLQEIRTSLPEDSGVEILAVSTEPSRVPDQALRDLLTQWNVKLPVVRDLEAFGRDVFRIPGAPTIVVLDRQGNVQAFEVGTDPQSADRISEILRQLRDGQDPASQLLAAYRTERDNYQRLVESGGAAETTVLEVPPTPIRPASKPQRLKLTKLWTNETFQAAGNLLVVPPSADTDDATPTILAFDGFQTVVQLSPDGTVQRRITLEIPSDFAATYLRSATDGSGSAYYAVSALRGERVFVFDQNWKQVSSYPPADQPHDGIHDCLLADLEGNGNLELCVGFWGLVGVHVVDLEGNRRWSNRAATNVLTLALTTGSPQEPRDLLASSDLGPIFRINRFGRQQTPIRVADRAIHHLYAHPRPAQQSAQQSGPSDTVNGVASNTGAPQAGVPYCGLSYQGPGQMLALGLDSQFAERWSYTLPGGTYQTEVQFVTPLTLPDGNAAWVLAGPDGSVHIVRSDGEFYDHFGVGAAVTGVASTPWKDRTLLLVATSSQVTAWDISP